MKGRRMRLAPNFSAAAMLAYGVLTGGAMAQPWDQTAPPALDAEARPGSVAGNVYDSAGVKPGTDAVPARLSDGTLAESANTTALATSTYHQPTSFLPGMKP